MAAQHADETVRLEAVEAIQAALCRWWPGCLTEVPQGDLGVDVFVLSFLLVISDGFVLKGLRGS